MDTRSSTPRRTLIGTSFRRLVALPCVAVPIAFAAPTAGGSADSSRNPHLVAARVVVVGTVTNARSGAALPNATVLVATGNRPSGVFTDSNGHYSLPIANVTPGTVVTIQTRYIGYVAQSRQVTLSSDTVRLDVSLEPSTMSLSSVVVTSVSETEVPARTRPAPATAYPTAPAPAPRTTPKSATAPTATTPTAVMGAPAPSMVAADRVRAHPGGNREQYDRIEDNPFLAVRGNALSTFSIDVDRASYTNVRRYLNGGALPPADAVRIEELVNYFPYSLRQPRGNDPVAITTEVAPAPWQPRHQLVRIALQARRIDVERLPASNLVFLLDVSGSMQSPDKLPLVKQSLHLLVNQMREEDRIALVVYAGSAGLVLPSTSGADKAAIMRAIDRLEAGGSTAGGAGLMLAYRTAREHFLPEGNNRVILATDGDFNVGPSSDAAMERLIESKRSEGTYLTVLGFGTGNLQDAKMQKLAKVGNGNYAYIDNLNEARKTLVREMGGTLVTVANDVKLQVEFNPAAVRAYRLIGYENRLLRNEDFADDRKDAGDIGSGHTVTALYEVVPVGVENTVRIREVDGLRYETPSASRTAAAGSELLHVKLRYKQPGATRSALLTHPVRLSSADTHPSDDFRFAASVASFGMLLRGSEYKGNATGADVLRMARGALGEDVGGYRAEFVHLLERWREVTHLAAGAR